MLIAGIIALVVAVVLVVVHVIARRKAGYLTAARNSTAGELAETASTVGSEIGGGSFTQFAHLSGSVDCAEPLISPLAEVACLYYRMSVSRRYEEEYWDRDQKGNKVRRTRTGSELMSNESDQRDFDLADQTGSIRVRLQGADFDGLRETVDRFEPADGRRRQIGFGRFSLSVSGPGIGRRTLGYQYTENVLPADARLTVIGEVTDEGGALSVRHGEPVFIVSTRTKKEMLGSAKKTAQVTAALSGICALAGIVMTIIGAVSG